MLRVAINGFGRIGRNILRALYENGYRDQIEIMAINDLAPIDDNAHLLQFDTTHGRFKYQIKTIDNSIVVDGDSIPVFCQRDPSQLPWQDLDVDIVFECTGFFRSRDKANLHLAAGARKVLVSAPGKQLDKTIVFGVNQSELSKSDVLVSNASCTTNCLAHVAKAIEDAIGIESGLATTIHAYTNTQNLLDSFHKDKRRGRAANMSMIPTSTGSAKAIGQVIPSLKGKLDAVAVRVPTINVSLLDFTVCPIKQINADQLIEIFQVYASNRTNVFELSDKPLVSVDFNHHPASCVVDVEQIRVINNQIKIQAWYDNEWGFSNRMLDTALAMHQSN